MSKIVVGMSGGVDSSVTAALLKEQGHEVIGLFMKNWEETAGGPCTSEQDFEDVVKVCEKIDIPYYSVEFVKQYRDQVFAYFLEQYKKGFTPNPDILCNREIKFDIFMKHALELGADYLATGHYARVIKSQDGKSLLGRGLDSGKDQSYFLNAISSNILDKVMFPIGDLQKFEVRQLAEKYDLATKNKKDSTGICFIGERDFREFLSNYMPAKPGLFCSLSGEVIGEHIGTSFYTLGQRKGLGLGGAGEPWFVVAKDGDKNIVYVERGLEHPALFTRELWASEESWISESPLKDKGVWVGTAKTRYRQPDQICEVTLTEDGSLYVKFEVEQRSITPGQFIVFYEGDICLGGAVMQKTGPTLWEREGQTWPLLSQGV